MYKNNLKCALITTLILLSAETSAITPKNTWYAGVFLGPSTSPASKFDFGRTITFSNTDVSISASASNIKFSVLGGIGGQIGYRFCDRHRIEGEFYYNNSPIKQLKLYNYSLTNSYYPAANETVAVKTFDNIDNTSNSHIQGETNTGAFMLNFIYDLFTTSYNNDGFNKVVPFIGLGVGYAYAQNAMQLYRPTTSDPANDPNKNREILDIMQKRYNYAGQALIGINYFMDDFTWFGIDLRYFTTGSSNAKTEYTYISPYATYTTMNSASLFNKKTQILSANLSFNGTLNFL